MKILKITGGFALIGLGAVMLVTPGPGWLAIGFGLTLLASEFEWAREWRDRLKEQGKKVLHAPRH